MKRQAADEHIANSDNANFLPFKGVVWLPEHTEGDDGTEWPQTVSSKRIQDASVRIALEESLEYARNQRRTAIQDLTRRFFIQIRAGCGNHHCNKVLCFSCQSRVSRGPVRRPTVLTARIQSFVLAEESILKARLCPDIARLSYHEILEKYSALIRDDELKGSGKKDCRSLTQNLFDTAAIKLFQASHSQEIREGDLSSLSRDIELRDNRSSYDFTTTHAAERTPSRRQRNSNRELSRSMDQGVLEEPTAPSPNNSSRRIGSSYGIINGQEHCSPRPNQQARKTTSPEILPKCNGSNKASVQFGNNRECSTCQQKLQTYRHTEVLKYMDCELIDDIKHLLSREELHRGCYNRFKILHVNASDPANERICPSPMIENYLRRSVHHCLCNAEILARSFQISGADAQNLSNKPTLNVINFQRLSNTFSFLLDMTGSLVYDSLWQCLQSLYEPPPGIPPAKILRARLQPRTRLESSFKANSCLFDSTVHETEKNSSMPNGRPYISDLDAAYIIFVCLCSFSALWIKIEPKISPDYRHRREYLTDNLNDESKRRLLRQVVRVIAARRLYWDLQNTTVNKRSRDLAPRRFPLISILLDQISKVDVVEKVLLHVPKSPSIPLEVQEMSLSSYLALCFRNEIHQDWDGKETHKKCSVVGEALNLLRDIYFRHEDLNLNLEYTYLNISHHLDPMSTPVNFVKGDWNSREIHLLSYPWLFEKSSLVQFFRTINYVTMAKAADDSEYLSLLMNRFVLHSAHRKYLNTRLKVALNKFLVVNIRRENILEDSFNQLWQRERRELLRPLKVIMGSRRGEEGLDQGGVSLEYFRLAVNEAFSPAVGMFEIDPITNTAWFQPASLEPLYRYELLGLIFSLAVYNGVTLSVNFPMVLYLKLVGQIDFTIKNIRDGWPQLAKGLDALLSWDEGDVRDVFMRTYDFSYKAYDKTINVQMKDCGRSRKQPALQPHSGWHGSDEASPETSPDSSEFEREEIGLPQHEGSFQGAYVTNTNREEYVNDYIYWLTHKSIEKQYKAFEKGFYACLDKKALMLLTPEHLKSVVEGHKEIDVDMIREVAVYEDGYDNQHPLIEGFWKIVEEYDEQSRSQLLEFVTASDRVPVNGVESMSFAIVRNGGDCDRIPTAMTCFGKLLLPEYSSVEKLREKLRIALENSRGFGSI